MSASHDPHRPHARSSAEAAEDLERLAAARYEMVARQIQARGIDDARILSAFEEVPRHAFVPADLRDRAYEDSPLPIGHGQTISQPYIVALMADLAGVQPHSRALDVGTGCGYQAAILSRLCRQVYSIEVVEPLATTARDRLAALGYDNIIIRHGDGYAGWPEEQPFDLIIGAAAPAEVPQPLVDQLAAGGRLVLPVGTGRQKLLQIEKQPDGSVRRYPAADVSFVPMTHA